MNNTGTIKHITPAAKGITIELADGRTIKRNWDRDDDPNLYPGMTITWNTWSDFNQDEWFDRIENYTY